MIQKTFHSLAAALAVAILLAAAPATASQKTPAETVSLGVVDTNKVMSASLAAKSVAEELEKKRKEFAAQVSKEQDNLRSAGKKFEEQQASLDKDQLEARRKKLNEQHFTLQKKMQNREKLLNTALNQSLGTLRKETRKVVEEIALERKLSAVLTQDAVILSVSQMDITPEVLKRLNARVKTIPIDWSELAKGAKNKKEG